MMMVKIYITTKCVLFHFIFALLFSYFTTMIFTGVVVIVEIGKNKRIIPMVESHSNEETANKIVKAILCIRIYIRKRNTERELMKVMCVVRIYPIYIHKNHSTMVTEIERDECMRLCNAAIRHWIMVKNFKSEKEKRTYLPNESK